MPPLALVMSQKEDGRFVAHSDISNFDDFISPTIEIVHKCERRCIEKSRVRIPWEYALERGANSIELHVIELSQPFPLAEETAFCDAESGLTWRVPGKNGRKPKP